MGARFALGGSAMLGEDGNGLDHSLVERLERVGRSEAAGRQDRPAKIER
jgi:hypothetical protein